MPNHCGSENSSRSRGGCLLHPASSRGSSKLSSTTCKMDLSSPGPGQGRSALSSGCQETVGKPSSRQTSSAVLKPCLRSGSRPRTSTLCRPFETTSAQSQGRGSRSSCVQGCGPGSASSGECGSRSFRAPARQVRHFPSLNYVSGFCHPDYLTSSTCRRSQRYPASCGSSYPSIMVHSTGLSSPRPSQLGSRQETCREPSSCRVSPVVFMPCRISYSHPRPSSSCGISCFRPRPSSSCGISCFRPRSSSSCGISCFRPRSSSSCGISCFRPRSSSSCGISCFRPRPSSSCRMPCHLPRPSAACSPCRMAYSSSLGSSSSCSQVYRSGSSYSVGCGSSSFRPLACGVHGFPSLSHGSGACGPIYLTSSTCQNFSSSENFYSTSTRGTQNFPVSSCGSSYPSMVAYSPDLTSPSTCQLGSPLSTGCQETFCEPSSCPVSRVVSSPCQTSFFRPGHSAVCSPCVPSCFRPRLSLLSSPCAVSCNLPKPSAACGPCGVAFPASQGCGSSSSFSQVYQSGSSYSVGCGSNRAPLACGFRGFPSLSLGSGVCRPVSLNSSTCQNFSSSENFYSTSTRGTQNFPVSSCGSSYPSMVAYSPDLTSPSTCQLGSPLSTGCQETFCEPSSCPVSRVVSSPCQTSFFRPGHSAVCSPCVPSCSHPRPFNFWGLSCFRPRPSSPCGVSCYRPRTSVACSPCEVFCSRPRPSVVCSPCGVSCPGPKPSAVCSPSRIATGPAAAPKAISLEAPPQWYVVPVASDPWRVNNLDTQPPPVVLPMPATWSTAFANRTHLSIVTSKIPARNPPGARHPTTYAGSLGCRSNSSCSGNFSRSLGGYISYPASSCGSSYPSNLVYTTDLCSPGTCQLGSSVSTGCQETCCEPSSCQTSCVVSSPCLPSCSRPRTSVLCSPCQTTYAGSLGCRSNSSCSLGCAPRSYYSLGCAPRSYYSLGCGSRSFSSPFFGSYGFRSLGFGDCGFPSLSWGSRFYYPTYFGSRSCQSSCYRPTCGSTFSQSCHSGAYGSFDFRVLGYGDCGFPSLSWALTGSTWQSGSSLYTGCQETCCEPSSCQMSCPLPDVLPALEPHALQFLPDDLHGSLGDVSRSCSSLGHDPLLLSCIPPSLSYGLRFCCPIYFGIQNLQSPDYQSFCDSSFNE
ncbi:Keratin-associated protein 13-1 [Galemys pyrenaicus]|uniref:Keratin-associated protein n=1 Tax=Galemys pyrenaicus TaxID=202257 RepID=A0A8J6AGQ0_GALPY|nr:Keratin-associated protein 13-1 [Galemys pyrenaicus]